MGGIGETEGRHRGAVSLRRSSCPYGEGGVLSYRPPAPRASALLGAIGRRQKRDKMILAVVMGLCIGFTLIYAFG